MAHLNIDLGDDDSQDGGPRPPSPRGVKQKACEGNPRTTAPPGPDSEAGNIYAWEETASTVSDLTLDTMQMQIDSFHSHTHTLGNVAQGPRGGSAPKSHGHVQSVLPTDPSAAYHPAFRKQRLSSSCASERCRV